MLHVRHVRTMCRRRSNIAVCVPLVPSWLEYDEKKKFCYLLIVLLLFRCGWCWFVYRRGTRCVVSSRLRRQPRCRSERVHHEPAHAVADSANCCAYARGKQQHSTTMMYDDNDVVVCSRPRRRRRTQRRHRRQCRRRQYVHHHHHPSIVVTPPLSVPL